MARFTKEDPTTPARAFAWEAAGLAWLAQAGGPEIATVHSVGDDFITEDYYEHRILNASEAEGFGYALAAMHAAGAPSFGAGPPGWEGDGYIGRASLPLGTYDRWGEFYAELRILPYLQTALHNGTLTLPEGNVIEAVCQRLRDGEFDDGRPPARIHGDLWNGNVLSSSYGAVLIDPAAQGGAGETDLAMLALFGFPHLDRVQAAYSEAAGLASDWRDRIGLHQLHPLLVHAVLFGRSYAVQAYRAARALQ